MGEPVRAALGVHRFLGVSDEELYAGLSRGVHAIVAEFEAAGSSDDLECLEYILRGTSGSNGRRWANGVLDEGREPGLPFSHFVDRPEAREADLSPAHVLALRLYSTAAYRSINNPLRDEARAGPHPLAVTVAFINEGLKRLRAVSARADDAYRSIDLWRGMRDLHVTDEFMARGGTEQAPMSTTRCLDVAVQYSASDRPLLLKLKTTSFMERGADLAWCSAFPGEAEVCFPPLTFLVPTSLRETICVQGHTFTVVEVEPHFAS